MNNVIAFAIGAYYGGLALVVFDASSAEGFISFSIGFFGTLIGFKD